MRHCRYQTPTVLRNKDKTHHSIFFFFEKNPSLAALLLLLVNKTLLEKNQKRRGKMTTNSLFRAVLRAQVRILFLNIIVFCYNYIYAIVLKFVKTKTIWVCFCMSFWFIFNSFFLWRILKCCRITTDEKSMIVLL